MGIFNKKNKASPPNPPEQESGMIEAIGFGEVSVTLDFIPNIFNYEIIDDPHDPGPFSSNPVPQEKLTVTSNRVGNSSWQIDFKWHVFGVKHISWKASE